MTRRIIIAVVALVAATATLNAQPMHNDTLRTGTWSIYAQGGLSGSHGMRGIDDQYTFDKTAVAPALDMGVFMYPRPWIRFGLGGNYSYIKQSDPGVQTYQEALPNYKHIVEGVHYFGTLTSEGARIQNSNFTQLLGADLTMGINWMEIWRERYSQGFNIWTSVGVGYMHGWNTYTRSIAWDHSFISNDGMYSWTQSEVNSPVMRNSFDAPYVPLGLSLEYDIVPQLSLALFGQYKFFPANINHTPTGIWMAGAGLRFNLVGKRMGLKSKRTRINELENELRYYASRNAEAEPVVVSEPAPVQQPGQLLEVDKPLSHFAVQIYAFRIFQHAPDDKIFFNDNPTIYRNGDLRRYVVFTGTLEEAKAKWRELRTRYHDAFIVYIDDDGVVVPYTK